MDTWKRWQDWGTLILGALVIIAPFAFGARTHTAVVGTAVAIGVLMVFASLWALYQPGQQVPHYVNLVLAVLLFISPWVIGFTTLSYVGWSAWIIAVLVFLLAGSVLATSRRRLQKV